MKALLRDVTGGVLAAAGLTAPNRFGHGRLHIATFHRVLPGDLRARYPYPMLAVTPEELDWFLSFFSTRFLIGTLASSMRLFTPDVFPERPLLAITFDDGQADNHVYARPVLERHRAKATFFVPVDAVERGEPLWHDRLGFAAGRDAERLAEEAKTWGPEERRARVEGTQASIPEWARMMTWDEVRSLAGDGHEIGSHSMSHALLPELDVEGIEREVAESKARIEAAIDGPIVSFCYPNGDADDRCAAAVRDSGYLCAVTTRWGSNAARADRFRLARCDMNPAHSTDARGRMSAARVAWRMSRLSPVR